MTDPNSAQSRPDWIADPMSEALSSEPPSTSPGPYSATAGLADRFVHHPPRDEDTVRRHESARAVIKAAALTLDTLVPAGREKALVFTKLEEAGFWAHAGIARHPGSAR